MKIQNINHKISDILKYNIDKLMCPICNTNLNTYGYSLNCIKNHCFDISKTGYINFGISDKKYYDTKLFNARKFIAQLGFFDKMLDEINSLLNKYFIDEKISILDVGCGEGSHLKYLKLKNQDINAIGFDISRDGINIASKNCMDVLFLVADMNNIPMKDKSIDVILNILSPANYSQFKRVLKNNGLIFKVVPTRNHLKELRHIFLNDKTYDDTLTIDYLKSKQEIIETKLIENKVNISDMESWINLTSMTPLTCNVEKRKIEENFNGPIDITLSVEIIVCK